MPTQKKKNTEERPNCYHDPQRLLKTYRDARWNLKLTQEQYRQDFEDEYGMDVTQYLDELYDAGMGFAGTKLEHQAKSMKRTSEMLKLIDASAHLIREHNSDGESFYWILYYTYLSPQKLSGVSEIVERIQMHLPYITRDTYFKQRKKATKVFSSVLWGFTARDEIDVLNAFISEMSEENESTSIFESLLGGNFNDD
jgi:hypothetical protein